MPIRSRLQLIQLATHSSTLARPVIASLEETTWRLSGVPENVLNISPDRLFTIVSEDRLSYPDTTIYNESRSLLVLQST